MCWQQIRWKLRETDLSMLFKFSIINGFGGFLIDLYKKSEYIALSFIVIAHLFLDGLYLVVIKLGNKLVIP
jgi:hypothetical protein